MNRYRLQRTLGTIAVVLILAGIVIYVLSKVLGWSSIGSTIGMWMSWGPSLLIALAFLVRLMFPRRHSSVSGADAVGEPINDLYLGRVSSPPIVRTSDEYSAYPPRGDSGR